MATQSDEGERFHPITGKKLLTEFPSIEQARKLLEEAGKDVSKLNEWNELYDNSGLEHQTLFVLSSKEDRWYPRKLTLHGDIKQGHHVELMLHHVDISWSIFQWCDLRGALMYNSVLDHAKFVGTDLSDAVLDSSSLRHAQLSSSKLQRAMLTPGDLRNAILIEADLQDADLQGSKCQEADFTGANLEGANLVGVDFTGAKLTGAKFKKRSVHPSRLRNRPNPTHVKKALKFIHGKYATGDGGAFDPSTILDNADMREVEGFIANGQSVRGTQFSPKSSEPYSIVRSEYAGSMIFFHFAALVIFFTPIVLRTSIWVGAARIQDAVSADVIPFTDTRSVFFLVMGAERGTWLWGWLPAVPAFLLLLYNIVRFMMTWWLSKVRDAEERSQRLPLVKDYWWCYLLHKYFMRILFWIALGSFVINLVRWMGTPVVVPG